MMRTLENDKLKSREITLEEWRSRAWHVKLRDWFWSLFRQQM